MKKYTLIILLIMLTLLTSCSTYKKYYLDISRAELEEVNIVSNGMRFVFGGSSDSNIDSLSLSIFNDFQFKENLIDFKDDSIFEVDFSVNGLNICSDTFEYRIKDNVVYPLETNKYPNEICANYDVSKSFDEDNIAINMNIKYINSENIEGLEEIEVLNTNDLPMYYIQDTYYMSNTRDVELGVVSSDFTIITNEKYITRIFLVTSIDFNIIEGLEEGSTILIEFSSNDVDLCINTVSVEYTASEELVSYVKIPSCSVKFSSQDAFTKEDFGWDSVTIVMTYSYNDVSESVIVMNANKIEDRKLIPR